MYLSFVVVFVLLEFTPRSRCFFIFFLLVLFFPSFSNTFTFPRLPSIRSLKEKTRNVCEKNIEWCLHCFWHWMNVFQWGKMEEEKKIVSWQFFFFNWMEVDWLSVNCVKLNWWREARGVFFLFLFFFVAEEGVRKYANDSLKNLFFERLTCFCNILCYFEHVVCWSTYFRQRLN